MAGDDDSDDDAPGSTLLGASAELGPEHESQRAITQTLVHELDAYACVVVILDRRGTNSSACISGDVPDDLNVEVIKRLAAGMRRAADEIEAWVRKPRTEDKH
jgi:hypothetical protein